MVDINLLSWREQKLAYERKSLRLLLILAIGTAAITLGVIHLILNLDVRQQAQHLQAVQSRHEKLLLDDQEDNPKGMDVKRQTIHFAADMLDKLAESARLGVCYRRVALQENDWEMTGNASSMWSLTAAQRVLISSGLFANLILQELLKDMQRGDYEFTLRVPFSDSAGE